MRILPMRTPGLGRGRVCDLEQVTGGRSCQLPTHLEGPGGPRAIRDQLEISLQIVTGAAVPVIQGLPKRGPPAAPPGPHRPQHLGPRSPESHLSHFSLDSPLEHTEGGEPGGSLWEGGKGGSCEPIPQGEPLSKGVREKEKMQGAWGLRGGQEAPSGREAGPRGRVWVFRRAVKLLVAAGGRLCPLGSWERAGFFSGGGLSPGDLAGLGIYCVEPPSLWRGGSTSDHSCASHTPSCHAQRGGAGILDVAQGRAGGLWCYSCPGPWSPAINTQATPPRSGDGVGTVVHGWARRAEASTAPGDLLAHLTLPPGFRSPQGQSRHLHLVRSLLPPSSQVGRDWDPSRGGFPNNSTSDRLHASPRPEATRGGCCPNR